MWEKTLAHSGVKCKPLGPDQNFISNQAKTKYSKFLKSAKDWLWGIVKYQNQMEKRYKKYFAMHVK